MSWDINSPKLFVIYIFGCICYKILCLLNSISGRNASSKILQMAWMYPRKTWRGLYEILCLLNSISGRNVSSKILQMAWMYLRKTWRGLYEIICLLFQTEMPVLRYYRWPGCTSGTHEGVSVRLYAFYFRQKCQFWDITAGLDVPQEHMKGSLWD